MPRITAVALLCALLAAPVLAADPPPPAAPAAKSCLALSSIRQSTVRDDQTIDFELRDGSVWRSTLPYRCPSLGYERAFSYATSINQLCSMDIITVVQQSSTAMRGASCGLGKFVRQPPAPSKPQKP